MKVAEPVEPRASAERNPQVAPEAGTQRPAQSESGLSRIRAAARKDRTLRFNNLLHHLTVTLLWQAYDRLKHKAAPGVDGVDWYGYGQNLLANLVGRCTSASTRDAIGHSRSGVGGSTRPTAGNAPWG
jgi:hypothetical protein